MMRAMRTGLWLFCICWVGWANGVAAETKNTGEDTAPVAITAEDVQQDQHVLIDPPSHPPLPNTITHSAEENTNPRSTHRQHSRAYRLPALHAREDDNNDMSLSTSTSDVQTRTAAHQRRQSPNALSMLFGYLPPVLDSFYTPINDLFRVVIDDLQAQGILANVNVSTKFRVTDNVRALAIANTFQLMTEDKAAGLIGLLVHRCRGELD
ncbi:hypothetical protein DFJ77DRAFT_253609 [Powellomyces hirtus]|nr:hypothetical protein DFJ77DRAFT_253609 [Powellomyces hirtus]